MLKDIETSRHARRERVYPVFRDEAGRSAGTGGRPSEAGGCMVGWVVSAPILGKTNALSQRAMLF